LPESEVDPDQRNYREHIANHPVARRGCGKNLLQLQTAQTVFVIDDFTPAAGAGVSGGAPHFT
jgi:hypothetical protein